MSDLVPLAEIAAEFGLKPRDLTRLEARGKFPTIVVVTQRRKFVRREDYERWRETRSTEARRTASSSIWTDAAAERLAKWG